MADPTKLKVGDVIQIYAYGGPRYGENYAIIITEYSIGAAAADAELIYTDNQTEDISDWRPGRTLIMEHTDKFDILDPNLLRPNAATALMKYHMTL